MTRVICTIAAAVVFSTVCAYGQDEVDFSRLSGQYLGQSPPGKTFQPFAPGIALGDILNTLTFSPDGKEAYWATRRGIVVTRLVDGGWTEAEFVSFSGTGTRPFFDDAPVISPDNGKLYFTSRRPIGYPTHSTYHIWYVERTSSGWSDPRPLPEIINTTPDIDHWQVSISESGTLYFNIFNENGPAIYFSNFRDGEYTSPKPLSIPTNDGTLMCPFIAPDESYIIFNRKVRTEGEDNLRSDGYYISFRGEDDEWLPPQKMFQLEPRESSFVTRDGKYIIVKDLWASAEIIEEFRPKR